MALFRPTRAQMCVLHVLTANALLWLLFLTCYKEFWGFWQSPAIYGFLRTEYPQWLRDYVSAAYGPTLACTLLLFFVWLGLAIRGLRAAARRPRAFLARLALVCGMVFLLGTAMGVRWANNLIGWMDSGRWHGRTHLQVRE